MAGKLSSFFQELKRRKVYRVATVYAITAWLIIQIVVATFPHLHLPAWLVTAVIVFVLIGFPVALVLAWAFEISPEGLVRTSSPEAENNPLPDHKRKPFTGTGTTVFLVVLLIAQFVYFQMTKNSGAQEINRSAAEHVMTEASLFPQKSIAVLPFKNMSAEKENEFFSDGVMEAILNNLSRIKDLKVVSRTSVERYRDQKKSIPEISSELEVANILEGSVQKSGNNVRITVQLIAADKDEHIWATHYDRDISDLFNVQSEIAKAIAENLKVILTSEERGIIENAPTANLKAYELFLRVNWDGLSTKREIERAIEQLKEVIAMDENFSWPYGSIAYCMYRLKNYGADKEIWADTALAMADKSLKLDPSNDDAYLTRALIYHDLYEFEKQKENLVLGFQYNPNNGWIMYELGNLYLSSGNYSQAIDFLLKALSINKVEENSPGYYQWLGGALALIDNELAVRQYKEAVKKYPDNAYFRETLCWNLLFMSDLEGSISYADGLKASMLDNAPYYFYMSFGNFFLKRYGIAEEYFLKGKTLFEENNPGQTYTQSQRLGYTQIQLGQVEEGRENINRFRKMILANMENKEMAGGIVVPGYYDLATLEAFEGHVEKAYEYLERSWTNHERGWFFMFLITHDPFWDGMREDERFQSCVKRFVDEDALKKQLFRSTLNEYHARGELKWLTGE